ncbi:MAG TPA: hypothetical protein VMW28_02205 [Pelolinea sp.]|nr:hypothetical protein [Pelolinea sp.]
MANKAVFEGLVFDEEDNILDVSYVGDEACYVVDDQGFSRHIPSDQVDCQVLDVMRDQIIENKDLISEQTAKMLGQEDLFTYAIINNQLDNIDDQLNHMMEHGLPESGRAYLGMLGFKIVVNYHGEVVRVDQPTATNEED